MTDLTISLSDIIWLCGGILGIAAFVAWVTKPIKKLDEHERRITTLEETVEDSKKTDRYVTRALNAIVNHMIDGNGIEDLKKVRDEFQNDIINK